MIIPYLLFGLVVLVAGLFLTLGLIWVINFNKMNFALGKQSVIDVNEVGGSK